MYSIVLSYIFRSFNYLQGNNSNIYFYSAYPPKQIRTITYYNTIHYDLKESNIYYYYLYRTSYTSVLTIVAFSMERYLAICHPLHSYAMSGLKRAVRIIAVVWMISFFAALPFAMFTTVDYVDYPPGNKPILMFKNRH